MKMCIHHAGNQCMKQAGVIKKHSFIIHTYTSGPAVYLQKYLDIRVNYSVSRASL